MLSHWLIIYITSYVTNKVATEFMQQKSSWSVVQKNPKKTCVTF